MSEVFICYICGNRGADSTGACILCGAKQAATTFPKKAMLGDYKTDFLERYTNPTYLTYVGKVNGYNCYSAPDLPQDTIIFSNPTKYRLESTINRLPTIEELNEEKN